MEICRLSCGGHGYSMSSGLPKIYAHNTPGVTYEGENTVLYLQTARWADVIPSIAHCLYYKYGRYLLKSATAAQSGKPITGIASYLTDKLPGKSDICQNIKVDSAIVAFKYRAMKFVNGRIVFRMQSFFYFILDWCSVLQRE